MFFLEKLNVEIKQSLKNKDSFRLSVLKYMKSLIQNNNLESNPKSELEIILNHQKKMHKSLIYYKDISLDNLKKEISIIEEFLPKPASSKEISDIVDKYIHLGNIGQIIKAVKENIPGSFDGSQVTSIIKAKLS